MRQTRRAFDMDLSTRELNGLIADLEGRAAREGLRSRERLPPGVDSERFLRTVFKTKAQAKAKSTHTLGGVASRARHSCFRPHSRSREQARARASISGEKRNERPPLQAARFPAADRGPPVPVPRHSRPES